ncbi:MAG: UDP-N-acetylmuramate dehydrogenase [Nitrospirae bacterium]|nr:UDP-N-acetylmuramate dehydrogenase [Nitrospirota bacterium]
MVSGCGLRERLYGEFRGDILTDVMLRDHTSLGIGGRAACLFIPHDTPSLVSLLKALAGEDRGYLLIGGGTNLLVSDEGLDEVIVSLRAFRRLETVEVRGDDVLVFAQSGLPLQRLISFCGEEGLSGLEGLVGVPGTVGGAVFGNAGAYGYEIMDAVQRVTVLKDGRLGALDRDDMDATYRSGGIPRETVILGVHISLKRDDSGDVRRRMKEFMEMKKKTQPVSERSAGCVFKNPPADSAARLIDEAGYKGMRSGGIEISRKHANFFINRGGGTAVDFLALMDTVVEGIARTYGVVLEPEIRIFGKRGESGR